MKTILKKSLNVLKCRVNYFICILMLVCTAFGFDTLPKITFDEHDHDFGNVSGGEELTHIFKFSNAGESRLIILQLYITDELKSVLSAEIVGGKTEFAPGESGEIRMTCSTKGLYGEQEVPLVVESNDPEHLFRLHVDFNVTK